MMLHYDDILINRRNNKIRQLEYRQMLDDQIRQNNYLKELKQKFYRDKIRYQPQLENLSIIKSRNIDELCCCKQDKFKSLDYLGNNGGNYMLKEDNQYKIAQRKSRKFIEKSMFFPNVHKNNMQNRLSQRSYTNQSHILYNSVDPQIQTIEAITQCDIILQNLKKLAKKQVNHVNKLIRTNQNSNRKIHDDINSIRKKSFVNYKTLPFQYPDTDHKTNYRDPNQSYNKYQNQANQRKLYTDPDELNQRPSYNKYNRNSDNRNNDNRNNTNRNSTNRNNGNSRFDNNRNEQSQQKQQQRRRQQQQQKERNKQRYMLKYLGNARLGGINLKKKIQRHQKKNQSLNNHTTSTLSFNTNEKNRSKLKSPVKTVPTNRSPH